MYARTHAHGKIPTRRSHPPESNRRPADYESAALPTELGWPGWRPPTYRPPSCRSRSRSVGDLSGAPRSRPDALCRWRSTAASGRRQLRGSASAPPAPSPRRPGRRLDQVKLVARAKNVAAALWEVNACEIQQRTVALRGPRSEPVSGSSFPLRARVDTVLKKPGKIRGRGMRGGGLEPPRVFSPLAPQTSASAISAILAHTYAGTVPRLSQPATA